jgi:O-glycosyl hydrolase
MRKIIFLTAAALLLTLGSGGCRANESKMTEPVPTVTPEAGTATDPASEKEDRVEYSKIKIDLTQTHQTWESFGASGAWWAQYIGGWDKKNSYSEITPRDDLAILLFDKEKGIGLSSFRYNMGAGSADSGKGTYYDPHRRAQSFESAPGVYDWSKDANAVWFVKKAVELNKDIDIILFCNSPLERLTKTGKAQSLKNSTTNIEPEKYGEFASYCFDVAEHFLDMGIPVTEISPINEPQWEWLDGQEGMHLDEKAIVGILETFVNDIKNRSKLADVTISGPESGEWGGKTKDYVNAIMKNPTLRDYFKVLDCHSYWTKTATKTDFKNWIEKNYPGVTLRTSEWCEMVNGSDYTMDSAFNMADVIMEDIKILDVSSWQLWVAISPGGYRDGLIHVNESKQAYRATRRLWAMGNFSRFIRPGFVRVDASAPFTDLMNMQSVAFKGVGDSGKEELVIVLTNREDEKTFRLDIKGEKGYDNYEIFTTTEEKDLELTASGEFDEDTVINIEGKSIVTIRLKSR